MNWKRFLSISLLSTGLSLASQSFTHAKTLNILFDVSGNVKYKASSWSEYQSLQTVDIGIPLRSDDSLRVPEDRSSYAVIWCNDFGKQRIDSGTVKISKICSIQESQEPSNDEDEISPTEGEVTIRLNEEIISTPNTTSPKSPNVFDSQQSSTIRIEASKLTNWHTIFSISLLSTGFSLVNHNAINAETLKLLSQVSRAVEGKAPWRVRTQKVRTIVLCDNFQKWGIDNGTITIPYKCPTVENL